MERIVYAICKYFTPILANNILSLPGVLAGVLKSLNIIFNSNLNFSAYRIECAS